MIKFKNGKVRLEGRLPLIMAEAILICRSVGKCIRAENPKALEPFVRDIRLALGLVTKEEFEQGMNDDIKRVVEEMEADDEGIPPVPEK